eukprot:TRINITY_DN4727_c0_g1_i1.p1 TRINITY_DN4727_c0_g1~~TRINITY_DN4727_c0_g1_i1.p1  ORF type:complete len:288 (+),score=51.39 TRINITY_DN4727_c0_g1_i1:330-1193(+)
MRASNEESLCNESEQAMITLLGELESEFLSRSNQLNSMVREHAVLTSSNSMLQQRVESLTSQNRRLMKVMESLHSRSDDRLELQKRITLLEEKALSMESCIGELKEQNRLAATEYESRMRRVQEEVTNAMKAKDHVIEAAKEALREESEHHMEILKQKEHLVRTMKMEIAGLKSEREQVESSLTSSLEACHKSLNERKRELVALRKEHNELSQTHDKQLQQARMKYEENLLKAVQSGKNDGQLDAYKKKLVTVQAQHEQEVAALKKRVLELEHYQKSMEKNKSQSFR